MPKKVAKKAKPAKVKSKRKPNPEFMKPMQPSEALAKIVGSKPLPRTEVVKKVWAYIKKNGLQDKENKRQINADENLKVIFGGKKSVTMFEMTKLVNKHLK
ncbi:MAG: SWIB/MDM2 domain-containing protein [Deltaproteobacteria bacterium]|nr:SWIB/MDM2 domain-containing protein [Deltaproteobacteria bacterium]